MQLAYVSLAPVSVRHLRTNFLCRPTQIFVTAKHYYRSRNCVASASEAPHSFSGAPTPEHPVGEEEELLRSLNSDQKKWSEIPFGSLEEELAAIDEYVKEEEPPVDDPWPMFLRGAAFEHWGQPQTALDEYARIGHATGFKRVPELWNRRAYNAFKVGNVQAAHAYFELGISLMNESTGNELHFAHWFDENFKDYLPKWNGPPDAVQRGIVKYCAGYPKEARNSFVPQIYIGEKDIEHPLLWFIACCSKAGGDEGISETDMTVVDAAIKKGDKWDPRIRAFVKLYYAAAKRVYSDVTELETELSEAIKSDEVDDITTYTYLALYHDAFTGDNQERDQALDIVAAMGSSKLPNDTENFLFHVAKNRISIPKNDTGESVEHPLPGQLP